VYTNRRLWCWAEAEGDPARAYASAEAKLSGGGRTGWRGFCNAGNFLYMTAEGTGAPGQDLAQNGRFGSFPY